MKTINLFFIGEKYYTESRTVMSSIYEVGTFKRSDWGKVDIELSNGNEINIRQATEREISWANIQLEICNNYRREFIKTSCESAS